MKRPILFASLVLAAGSARADIVSLDLLGRYETFFFAEGGAEIVTYDGTTQLLFFVNAGANEVAALDIQDPSNPILAYALDIDTIVPGGSANSVDAHEGRIAVAIGAAVAQDPGTVVLLDAATGEVEESWTVGALPDMLTFTPDGSRIVVANEGEPSTDYANDPEGTVSIIELDALAGGDAVRTVELKLTFPEVLDAAIRIYGPDATPAQDMEPEYIAVSPDSRTAWVTLQENNAFARIDLDRGIIDDVQPLGFKDHSLPGNELDASDRDNAINLANWPVFGMYQPDAVVAYEVGGAVYLVTANEGDARDYDAFAEEDRVKDLDLDPDAFPDAATLQADANIGRLTVTNALGDIDDDGDFDALYALGARSISVWDGDGRLVWDSGSQLEEITAAAYPDDFNANHEENDSFDNRSDNKGPEPEGLALGEIDGRVYAFIGLERIGGVVVFDVTDPNAPEFRVYVNSRDFLGDPESFSAGDLGPEGLDFVPAAASPTGEDLLAVGNEISGTVALYRIGSDSGVAGAPEDAGLLGGSLAVVSSSPFSESATLRFALAESGSVDLALFDALGRRVATLRDGNLAAGTHEVCWDGRDASGRPVPSSVYYARLETRERIEVRRLVVAR